MSRLLDWLRTHPLVWMVPLATLLGMLWLLAGSEPAPEVEFIYDL